MTPYLRLLIILGIILAAYFLGLYLDRKEHEDERQIGIDFGGENERFKNNRVAMSRTQV